MAVRFSFTSFYLYGVSTECMLSPVDSRYSDIEQQKVGAWRYHIGVGIFKHVLGQMSLVFIEEPARFYVKT